MTLPTAVACGVTLELADEAALEEELAALSVTAGWPVVLPAPLLPAPPLSPLPPPLQAHSMSAPNTPNTLIHPAFMTASASPLPKARSVLPPAPA
ncbi:MAG TPA: hypothetical protein VLC92_11805 [Rhodocyclaceae bacterium]|nr:hypothetical protein [Rhodocyclaceae bacterium]